MENIMNFAKTRYLYTGKHISKALRPGIRDKYHSGTIQIGLILI